MATPMVTAAAPAAAPTAAVPVAPAPRAASPLAAARVAKSADAASSSGLNTASSLVPAPPDRLGLDSARQPPGARPVVSDPLALPLAQLAVEAGMNPQLDAERLRLESLQRAARGLWRPSPPLPQGVGQVVQDANGRVLGRLLVQGLEVQWHSAEGSWRALLPHPPRPH